MLLQPVTPLWYFQPHLSDYWLWGVEVIISFVSHIAFLVTCNTQYYVADFMTGNINQSRLSGIVFAVKLHYILAESGWCWNVMLHLFCVPPCYHCDVKYLFRVQWFSWQRWELLILPYDRATCATENRQMYSLWLRRRVCECVCGCCVTSILSPCLASLSSGESKKAQPAPPPKSNFSNITAQLSAHRCVCV